MRTVFLLGRRDAPTDGLEDYCTHLGRALEARGVEVRISRVNWAELGWWRSLALLNREAADWNGAWVLVQYTALQWSSRGLPLALMAVMWVLGRRCARIATVFHDSGPYPLRTEVGAFRWIVDRLRRSVQLRIMRAAARRSALSVLTVAPANASWVPAGVTRVEFLPVGPNIPEPRPGEAQASPDRPSVAVFALTGPPAMHDEIEAIGHSVRHAATLVQGLRLVVCGRNSALADLPLRRALDGSGAELSVLGVIPADEVTEVLASATLLLFVRGQVSSRRGSAIAGLACGLPIVGYAGSETGFPLTEAGVSLVPTGDRDALAAALVRVLTDAGWRESLRRRSVAAYQRHFAWQAIADQLLTVLAGA